MAFIHYNAVILPHRWRKLAVPARLKDPSHHRLNGCHMQSGVRVHIDITKSLHVIDVCEALQILYADVLERLSRLLSKRSPVDKEENPPKTSGLYHSVSECDTCDRF